MQGSGEHHSVGFLGVCDGGGESHGFELIVVCKCLNRFKVEFNLPTKNL